MSECPLEPVIERNASDIKTLTASVTELVSTVRVLAEGQKIRRISALAGRT